jgi:hypothetical protein
MRTWRVNLLLGVLAAAVSAANLAAAQTVNFSGKWMFEVPGRGGQMQRVNLLLNQVGNEVDGTISVRIDAGTGSPNNTEILDGKVESDTLTFYVWTGRDRPVKAHYKGILSGEEIKFNVTSGRGGPDGGTSQGGSQQFTAKRAK